MNLTKRVSWRGCLLILVAMVALGTPLSAAPGLGDPIVGDWFWHLDHVATFNADGTARIKGGRKGTWEYLHNPEVNRHYRVIWAHGLYVDRVVFTEDGQRAFVRSNKGDRYEVRRTLAD